MKLLRPACSRVFVAMSMFVAFFSCAARAQEHNEKLGSVNFPVSCTSEQTRFNRGVALLHNFFFPETVKAFQEIVRNDPECAMGYWGIAMSNRPNPLVQPFAAPNMKAGWEAVQKAKAAKHQTAREADYIAAMEKFYKDYDSVDLPTRTQRYRNDMEEVQKKYPADEEAAIFFALALLEALDLSDKTYSSQLKAAAILNEQASKHPDHPGVAHYLIHAYDFAPFAALCVPTARLYEKIAADAPHALHMPSHIYSMLGLWEDSIRSNRAAEASGNAYAAKNYPQFTDATIPHSLDFLMFAYLQLAKDENAQRLLEQVASLKPVSAPRLTVDTALAAIPARFILERAAWQEASNLPVRDSQYPAAQAITYFTRSMAAARRGDLAAAKVDRDQLEAIEAKQITAKDAYWAGQSQILKSAAAAWIAFAEGRKDEAISLMRKAADQDDASEKHVAMENKLIPVRALLGELYLAAGMHAQALKETETSLKTIPNRYQSVATAAAAARGQGATELAKRYYRALTTLAVDGNQSRPEIVEAKRYLAQSQ